MSIYREDTQFQPRSGTTGEHATFVGEQGEFTVDITKHTGVIHDGVTPGGHPLATEQALNAHLADKATQTKLGHVYAFRGARVGLSASQSVSDDTNTLLEWGTVEYDDMDFFSPSNPTRLTIPEDVSKVVLKANVWWGNNATGRRQMALLKNGSSNLNGRFVVVGTPASDGRCQINGSSAVLNVSEGDYFELEVVQTSGASINVNSAPQTWFSVEVVE